MTDQLVGRLLEQPASRIGRHRVKLGETLVQRGMVLGQKQSQIVGGGYTMAILSSARCVTTNARSGKRAVVIDPGAIGHRDDEAM